MIKKLLVTVLEIVLIALVVYTVITVLNSTSFGEELTEAYVICQPGDYVNVRMSPSKKSQAIGYIESGEQFLTDEQMKNGFIHCYGIGECGEGWIHAGYVVFDEPVRVDRIAYSISKAKLAARKYIGGKVRKWLKNMTSVTVYWMSDEWCVTSSGFMKTMYLEMEGT